MGEWKTSFFKKAKDTRYDFPIPLENVPTNFTPFLQKKNIVFLFCFFYFQVSPPLLFILTLTLFFTVGHQHQNYKGQKGRAREDFRGKKEKNEVGGGRKMGGSEMLPWCPPPHRVTTTVYLKLMKKKNIFRRLNGEHWSCRSLPPPTITRMQ